MGASRRGAGMSVGCSRPRVSGHAGQRDIERGGIGCRHLFGRGTASIFVSDVGSPTRKERMEIHEQYTI
jgi:hypothetical protein